MNAIKTERLTIRYVVADDWKSIKDIWVDFNTSALSQYDKPHITDDADVQPRIAKWAAANSGTEHMFFAVCLGDTVIGYIAFNIRENGHEIGYCFHSAYHGKGFAKESHLALIDYMRELGIKRLTAGTALNNTPSVALLKSLGFELIETEKVSFYKDANGNDIVFDGGVFELNLRNELRHPIIERTNMLQIEDSLRLRRFDGNYDFAFEWYQDPETVLLVDGKAEPYSYETLTNMYNYLNGKGELYFIEVNENGKWKPIGDVTFWQEDMPIVIGEREYRGKGIGKKVVSALVDRGRAMGYDKLYVGEIYDFNIGSQKCFESVGFRSYEKTEKGSRYVLELKK